MSAPTRLRAEHLDDPLGLAEPRPRLSWWLPDGTCRQTAYRITADNGWDTGRVASAESVLVPYDGPALASGRRVAWRVMVWSEQGPSAWSEPATFELGLLRQDDWHAVWVEPVEETVGEPGRRRALLLRGEVEARRRVVRARLHATAHGVYELFVNGARVGDAELTPGFTSYRQRLQVQTYDVTDLVRVGRNAVGAVLSDGWYRGQVGIMRAHDQWGSRLALLAQLHLEHDDGTQVVAGTGADWRWTTSAHVADLIAGQSTDLSAEPEGWDRPGFADAHWQPVAVADHGVGRLVGSPAPPVRRVEELTPVGVRRVVSGAQVFDLGQNLNGWVRLNELGPAGTVLTLTHGESVGPDGDVTTEHLQVDVPFLPQPLLAGQVDSVVSRGRPGDRFEPRHTTHGFRFVRVEGHPGELTTEDLRGVVVHTDLRRTGWFACSDERLNRLHEAAVWGFRGNACDIPTDCPTRERAGWTGDWQLYQPTAAFLYDVAGFSTKWLRDLAAEQWDDGVVANLAPSPPAESQQSPVAFLNGSAGWGDAAVLVPWQVYQAYGDRRLLAEQWDSMVAWLGHVERTAAGHRHPSREARGPARPHESHLWDTGFHWGEWLVPGEDPSDLEAMRAADHADVATAYFAHSSLVMSRVAEVLGRQAEAERYHRLADLAREAWQAEFVGPDGRLHPDTQANHVRALSFDLVPPRWRPAAAERLVALVREAGTHLGTGFLATPDLLPVLADHGFPDVAYELLLQDTVPSWLAMVDRGATTIWERWDGIDDQGVPHESLNHYSKGAVASFLHRYVAGILPDPASPAYRRFVVAPQPGGGLAWARGALDSPYGRIESAWRLAGGRFELEVVVPPGTSAEVRLPDGIRQDAAPGRHVLTCAWSGTRQPA